MPHAVAQLMRLQARLSALSGFANRYHNSHQASNSGGIILLVGVLILDSGR